MTMTKNTEALDTRATEYHSIYPHCADFDLRIFRGMCEGKAADTIAAERLQTELIQLSSASPMSENQL